MKTTEKTPFEQAKAAAEAGKLQVPSVSAGKNAIPFFSYQLAVVKMQLSLYSKGLIPHRGWRLKDVKTYYGLKGKTGAAVLADFMERIYNPHMKPTAGQN